MRNVIHGSESRSRMDSRNRRREPAPATEDSRLAMGKHEGTKVKTTRRTALKSISAIGVAPLALLTRDRPVFSANKRTNGGTRENNAVGSKRPSKSSMQIGVYDGSGSQAVRQGTQFERWIDTDLDVQNVFIPWDDGQYELDELFGQTVPRLWEAGRQPMVTWELFLTSRSTPNDILSRVADGDYDSFLEVWTRKLDQAVTDSSVRSPTLLIRLGHEMNGDWYPWAPAGGSGSPEAYIEMWRHVQTKVEAECETDVQLQWVWAANSVDVGEFTMEELYPGDEYVDWLAIDAYNWGNARSWSEWQSPRDIFRRPIRRLRSIGEGPVAVTEFGSSSQTAGGPDVGKKSDWITDVFATLDDLNVDLCVWFNEDKETDWAVFGGQRGDERITVNGAECETYSAFKRAIENL